MAYVLTTFFIMGFGYFVAETALKREIHGKTWAWGAYIVALVGVVWTLYGYSLAFGDGGSMTPYIGGFGKAFLHGVDANSTAATFSNGVVIP